MIHIKSPTRVDLAGGTLDMWPLYNFVGGATTINLAIDIWTEVELEASGSSEIFIESEDLKLKWKFADVSSFLKTLDPKLSLYQKIISKYEISKGFNLKTSSQSPIGGGLGGSSSLVISMLKAFNEFTEQGHQDAHAMTHLAHNIEAEILNTPTGTQDYYPAISGGMNVIKFTSTGINQKVIDVVGTPLEDHFLLVYTGKTHHSGLNNFEVLKSAVEGDFKVITALKKIKRIAEDMKICLENKNWSELPLLFRQEYEARIELTPAFSSPEIEKLAKISIGSGALAIKICGAGGGGCVLIWVPPAQREKVMKACQDENFQCLSAKPIGPLNS
ncbi:MAG: galactokinase [Bdellovibrio sp.]|nr:galactokinase [Bdellovibrio sp.]